jgi:hypothetical protein
MYGLKPVPFKELVRLQERPEEIGRVPLDKVEGFVKGRDVLSGE